MEQLLAILQELKPGVDFEGNKHLIDDGILESLEIITLASDLNDEFDIEITVADVLPENFNSIEAIWSMIERLQDED